MSDQPDLNSKSTEPHNPYQTAPNWLNSALLRTQFATTTSGADTSNDGGGGTNFLNLHTASDSTAASQASNQWLSRPILQRNHSDVIDDVAAGPGHSMIAGPELTCFAYKLLSSKNSSSSSLDLSLLHPLTYEAWKGWAEFNSRRRRRHRGEGVGQSKVLDSGMNWRGRRPDLVERKRVRAG